MRGVVKNLINESIREEILLYNGGSLYTQQHRWSSSWKVSPGILISSLLDEKCKILYHSHSLAVAGRKNQFISFGQFVNTSVLKDKLTCKGSIN